MAVQRQKLDSPGCKPEPSTQGYSPWGLAGHDTNPHDNASKGH